MVLDWCISDVILTAVVVGTVVALAIFGTSGSHRSMTCSILLLEYGRPRGTMRRAITRLWEPVGCLGLWGRF